MSECEWVYGWQEVMKSKKSLCLHWCFFGERSCLLHKWHTGAHTHTQSVILSVFKLPEIFQREHLHSPHMAPKTLTLSPVVPLP